MLIMIKEIEQFHVKIVYALAFFQHILPLHRKLKSVQLLSQIQYYSNQYLPTAQLLLHI